MFLLPRVPVALAPALVPALLPLVATQMVAARLHTLPGTVVDRVRTWPVESQHAARRNAMVASTALAQRRAEREDVEDFLSALTRAPAVGTAEVPAARSVNRAVN